MQFNQTLKSLFSSNYDTSCKYKNQNEGRHEMFGGGQPHAILVMDAKCLYDWLDYTRFPYSHYSTRRGNVPDSTVKLHWVS